MIKWLLLAFAVILVFLGLLLTTPEAGGIIVIGLWCYAAFELLLSRGK